MARSLSSRPAIVHFYLLGQLQSVTVTSHQQEPAKPVHKSVLPPPFTAPVFCKFDTDFLFKINVLIPLFFIFCDF